MTLRMKIFLIHVVIILSMAGCTDSDRHVKRRGDVNVSEVQVPQSGQVNQNIEIKLKAEATNGCWSNLIITMNEIDKSHFVFKATGLFESYGTCPLQMVYNDTIINFNPQLKGKYFFQTNEIPFRVMLGTLEIN